MRSIRLFALGFFQNNGPADLDPADLDPEVPIILPVVPQTTTAQGPWNDAKSLSASLIRLLTCHGLSTTAARKWVMMICLLLVSCAVWVGFIQSEAPVIALLCLTATGSAAYMVNYFAFGQDVAPSHTGVW